MQCGLPVLASINPGNDLAELIRRERVGQVCTEASAEALEAQAAELADLLAADGEVSSRCRSLYRRLFAPEQAVRQIVSALGASTQLSSQAVGSVQ
jgi:hypothetical protein